MATDPFPAVLCCGGWPPSAWRRLVLIYWQIVSLHPLRPQGKPPRMQLLLLRPTPDPIPAPATSVAVASEDSATVAVAAPAVSQASTQPVSPTRVSEPVGEGTGAGTAESPLILGFEKLASFQYTLPDGPVDTNAVAQAATTNQIPATIKSLNNRFITLKGFMLPLKVEKGLVTELLIMRDQSMCCYGTVPRINEWVSVKMVGTGVKPIMDQAVTFHGKLKVGEMYENGYLVGIYALDGERMDGPLDM